ncbi:hypothetical protein NM688_g7569 [Phlebia brevispora]|uniref:Uncharacterized protein n=1 Tax=Phlebia brevispora TaxID=194682 RepID=A0ACC1S3Q5_9APHY|nr:hypothetical protein NM688_g7569 [Phlebia brevispora]
MTESLTSRNWLNRFINRAYRRLALAMPDVSGKPFAPHYVPPPATQEDHRLFSLMLNADLAVIDLSKMSTPEGRAELVNTARDAMRDIGFFYVINHGLPREQHDRMTDIADLAYTKVNDDEKKFEGKLKKDGTYQGYKLRQDITKKDHPQVLKPSCPMISSDTTTSMSLHPVLRLLALGLELPEDTFVKWFGFEAKSDTCPLHEVSAHIFCDVVTGITILWSQSVSGLQMRRPDGSWRWIKHIDDALVINIGDSLDFISGGYYKATIHRAVQPPVDQRGLPRLGLFYFCMPDDDIRLVPVQNSPVLERVSVIRQIDDDKAPTAEMLRKGRIQTYGKIKLEKGPKEGTEIQYVAGVMVRH